MSTLRRWLVPFVLAVVLFGTQDAHAEETHVVERVEVPRSSTALMSRVLGGINSTGNANFSMLVGSFAGVRGLEDALYRNWMQAFANVELRQTIRIAERWAFQPVLFGDVAVFTQMDARGGAIPRGPSGRCVRRCLHRALSFLQRALRERPSG